MKDTRRVMRGIGVTKLDEKGNNGKYRVETDPDAIAGMYSQPGLDALVESGVLEADNPGEWKSTKAEEGSPKDSDEPAQDLSKMKVDELRALAEEKGVEGATEMKKADLIAALKG